MKTFKINAIKKNVNGNMKYPNISHKKNLYVPSHKKMTEITKLNLLNHK